MVNAACICDHVFGFGGLLINNDVEIILFGKVRKVLHPYNLLRHQPHHPPLIPTLSSTSPTLIIRLYRQQPNKRILHRLITLIYSHNQLSIRIYSIEPP